MFETKNTIAKILQKQQNNANSEPVNGSYANYIKYTLTNTNAHFLKFNNLVNGICI